MKGIFTRLFILLIAVSLLFSFVSCEFMSPMDSVQDQLDDQDEHNQEQDERISDLERWAEDFEDEFASYQDEVDSRFASVESHLDTVDGRLDNLELTDEELWDAIDEVNGLIIALQEKDEALQDAIEDVIDAYQDADEQLWQDTLDLIAQKEAEFMAEIEALTDRLAQDEQIFWQTVYRLVNFIREQDDIVRSEFQAADAQLRQDGEDAYNALQDTIYTTAQRLLNVMNTKAQELQGQIDDNAEAIEINSEAISGLTLTTGVLLNWNAYQQGQIWDLQDEVDAVRDELHQSVADLQTQIDNNYADLQAQINDNDADIASLVSDLSDLTTTVSNILDEQVAQNLRMDGMQDEIDALEVTASNLAADILALTNRMDVVEGDIETIQTNIVSITDSIATLADRVGDNEAAIADLQTALANLETRVGDVETTNDDQDTAISDLQGAIGDLDAALGDLADDTLTWRGVSTGFPSDPEEGDMFLRKEVIASGFGPELYRLRIYVFISGSWELISSSGVIHD